jgi:hypothetical protein
MWTCPQCGRSFANANQWHSCGTFRAADHLVGADPEVADLYRRFEKMVRACGPVTLTPTKSHIAFRALVQFAGVRIQKGGLRIGLMMSRRIDDPRFVKISTFSPGSHVHSLLIRRSEDLDEKLQGWLREAYRAGQTLQRPGAAERKAHSRNQKGA